MSNTTRVRTRPRHAIQLSSSQAVPMGVLFGGTGGCRLLESAVRELPALREKPEYAAARPWLAWRETGHVAGETNYQLSLEGAQLHPDLRAAGCNRVELDLHIKNRVAKIARRASWVSGQKPDTAIVNEALERTSNRAVNTLGAFAYSHALGQAQIAEKIQQRLAPKQAVQQRLRQQVRQTAGRNIAFQMRADARNCRG